jgi:hypothetical protein
MPFLVAYGSDVWIGRACQILLHYSDGVIASVAQQIGYLHGKILVDLEVQNRV